MEPALAALWTTFYADRTLDNRANLTAAYLPFVKRIAGTYQIADGFFDRDDLTSCGVIGLINAIDRYDPAYDTTFETYSSRRIRGQMVDSLREADWAPRSVRRKARYLADARQTGREAGHEPSHAEMADTMHLTGDEFAHLVAATEGVRVLSLDVASVSDTAQISEIDNDPAVSSNTDDIADTVNLELSYLTEREQDVLHSYYWDEETLKAIGAGLHVTESRASQIRTGAQRTLKANLTVAWRMD